MDAHIVQVRRLSIAEGVLGFFGVLEAYLPEARGRRIVFEAVD
jgi:hypothetical protein